ncbi:ubiquinone biosynthesis protein COQ4 [Archangium lipolyticum]|uniref:ubiquinone biosynthesis protein COQ4 n=1 Tax=Archangium lipolyticum TaxID=2970465 RepID=UPI002149C1FF|nr:ubiquinone biosynthesis protein COQ4 [Archangium lipolyticum]
MPDLTTPLPTLPENPSLLTRLQVGLQALKVLQVDPTNPAYGALFYDSVEIGLCAALAQDFSRHEEGRRLLAEKPSLRASALDLDALEKLPLGSLGHTFARYFREQGLTPIETLSPPKNDAQYVATRLRETHDFHHMVTGYTTDVMGEMELQAFTLGNLHLRTSLLILLQSAKASKRMPGVDAAQYARRLWAAFRRGSQSRQLASFRWEDHWATPLTLLCEQLVAPAQQWN